MKRFLLLTSAVLLSALAAHAAVIYTSPASFPGHDMDPFSNFNNNYSTPQNFDLPANTTLVSFSVTAPPSSFGVPFSVWLNNTSTIDNRLYVFNIQDSSPTFIGIANATAMSRIVLTTPNSGYAFTISNFQAGPFVPTPPPAETPEAATLLTMGSGLVGLAFLGKRKLDRKKPTVQRAGVEALQQILSELPERERNALGLYYNGGLTSEEACQREGVGIGRFRELRAEVRGRYLAATNAEALLPERLEIEVSPLEVVALQKSACA